MSGMVVSRSLSHCQKFMNVSSQKIPLEVSLVKPANFVIDSPQLTSFVDIDLARLLGVGLSEFLANPQSLKSCCKDASFAAEIRCTTEAKGTG